MQDTRGAVTVDPNLVRILADMVEASLRRDAGVQSEPPSPRGQK
jgi:hypothetical protein